MARWWVHRYGVTIWATWFFEHVVTCSHVANENHLMSTSKKPITTKLDKVVVYDKWIPHKSRMALWSRGYMRSRDKWRAIYLHIHDTRRLFRLDMVVAYDMGSSPTESCGSLITWLLEVTWQMKNIISPFPKSLWQGGGLLQEATDHKVTQPFNQMFTWGHVINQHDKSVFIRSMTTTFYKVYFNFNVPRA